MKQAVKEVLAKPKAGQTPLAGLVVRPQALAAEDYAFGNQSVLSSRISETTLKRLRELSITTQEELLGYLEIPGRDLSAFATLLESSPQAIPQIQDYLKATLDPMIISRFDAVGRETYAFGAFLPPPGAETSAQARSEITEPADDSALLNRECLPTIKDQGNRGACVRSRPAPLLNLLTASIADRRLIFLNNFSSGTASNMTAPQLRTERSRMYRSPWSVPTASAMTPSGRTTRPQFLKTYRMTLPGRH